MLFRSAPLGVAGLDASVGVVTLGDVDEEGVGAAVLDAARQLSDALG